VPHLVLHLEQPVHRAEQHREPRVDQVDARECEDHVAAEDDALGQEVVDDLEQRGVGRGEIARASSRVNGRRLKRRLRRSCRAATVRKRQLVALTAQPRRGGARDLLEARGARRRQQEGGVQQQPRGALDGVGRPAARVVGDPGSDSKAASTSSRARASASRTACCCSFFNTRKRVPELTPAVARRARST